MTINWVDEDFYLESENQQIIAGYDIIPILCT